MNYLDQQRYLKQSRMYAVSSLLALVVMASVCALLSRPQPAGTSAVFWMVAVALAICLCYLPDYLHLTVNPQRGSAWAMKVRWRIIGAMLVLGLLMASSAQGRIA